MTFLALLLHLDSLRFRRNSQSHELVVNFCATLADLFNHAQYSKRHTGICLIQTQLYHESSFAIMAGSRSRRRFPGAVTGSQPASACLRQLTIPAAIWAHGATQASTAGTTGTAGSCANPVDLILCRATQFSKAVSCANPASLSNWLLRLAITLLRLFSFENVLLNIGRFMSSAATVQ